MTTAAAKAKGRRLQQRVRDAFYAKWRMLRDGDVTSKGMGQSGRDVELSPTAEDHIPFDVECKNVERINIWQTWRQCVANTKEGRIPLVAFARNRSEDLVCLRLSDLLDLIPDDSLTSDPATRRRLREEAADAA